MKFFSRLAFYAASLLLSGCFKEPVDPAINAGGNTNQNRQYDWLAIADSAQLGLNTNFWNSTGKYFNFQMGQNTFNGNYWPNAHGLDALTDAYLRKNKDATIKQQMDDLIEGVKAANNNSYVNYYYDDMEWMLIATLRAFVATQDNRYKEVADGLWPEVKGGWSEVSGGGFYWRKDKVNKSTPSNAPACIFAARLYQLNKNQEDLNWVKKTYAWLKANMIRSNGDVWDGLHTNEDPIRYDSYLYTYNYGTVIGSALELYKITGDLSYQNDAIAVANAAIARLTRENLLVNGDNGDGGLFNGIFVRYLTRLIVEGDLPSTNRTTYTTFLKNNAETLWSKGTNKSGILFGPSWNTAPGNSTTLTPQLSGVMLMEAMAELKTLNLVK